MATLDPIDLLNQLLALQYRSFPMYLTESGTWVGPGEGRSEAALLNIVTDQRAMCRRAAQAILDVGGQVEPSQYSMDFTDTQFLSLEYLLDELIHYQKQDVASIEELVRQSSGDARSLAEEALGAERAHLESLQELLKERDKGVIRPMVPAP